jgi:hypothetical protein
MKHKLLIKTKSLIAAAFGAVLLNLTVHAQPITLSGTNYSQNFDGIGGGLPGEWLVYSGATPTSLGTLITFTNEDGTLPINDWTNFNFGFKNCASTFYSAAGTNFNGTEPLTIQEQNTNRALAVRTTGANDPGNAFVLKLTDTSGFGQFILDVDMLMLNPQGRSQKWSVDFGISPDGISPPSSFLAVSNTFYTTFSTSSVPAAVFGATHETVYFSDLLDDEPGPVWIRIVNLSSSSGANNRPTVGIDNFNLGFTNVAHAIRSPQVVNQPQNTTNLQYTTASLSVGVSGTVPFTYQWYKNSSPLSDGATGNGSFITGSATPGLTITSSSTNDTGVYFVTATNSAGGTNSQNAQLTITPRPITVTNIAYLRTLTDTNFLATNSIAFWQVTGIVTTFTNLTSGNTASYYLQDGTAGINIFETFGSSFRPNQGDVVTYVGFLSSFNSTLELEADPFDFPVTGPTVLSNNIAALPAPILIPFTATNPAAFAFTNLQGSIVMLSNVFFVATNSGSLISTNNNARVTNSAGQSFSVFASAQDLDLANGSNAWPNSAVTIIGPLTQNQSNSGKPRNANYNVTVTRLSDMVTNPFIVSEAFVPGTNTLTWASAPFTYPYSVWAATSVSGPYTLLTSGLHFPDTNGNFTDVNANADVEFYRISTP